MWDEVKMTIDSDILLLCWRRWDDRWDNETMRHNLAGEYVDIKVRRSYDYETMTIWMT